VPYHHGNLREELLEKAAEAIEEDGVGALSLRAVARRAGVSHGAPAHHFSDKTGLLTALATRAMDRFRATLAHAARESRGSERNKLRAIGMAYVCFAAEHPALFRIITRSEFIHRDDPEFSASYQSTIDMVKDTVIAAQREGWGRDMDPMALVITAWDGVLEDRVGPVDLQSIADQVFEILTAA
jgi:AcrR family transcriptional regulator